MGYIIHGSMNYNINPTKQITIEPWPYLIWYIVHVSVNYNANAMKQAIIEPWP